MKSLTISAKEIANNTRTSKPLKQPKLAQMGLNFGAHQKCSTSARIELPLLETVSGTTRVEGLRSSRGAASVFVVGGIEEG